MLLTENIAFRVREWMDRETPEPDLVPRFRRLWTEPHVTPARERAPGRTSTLLRRLPLLHARSGS